VYPSAYQEHSGGKFLIQHTVDSYYYETYLYTQDHPATNKATRPRLAPVHAWEC
jgi:hypothetical protein